MQYGYVLLLSACGWAMGTVFDVYNTVTGSSKWLRWLRPLLDMLFWCLSAAIVFYITFVTEDGRFRLYTFALLLIGYGLYRLWLHHAVVRSAFAITRAIQSLVRGIAAVVRILVLRPVANLLSALWTLVTWLYRRLCQVENLLVWILRLGLTVVLFPFRPLWQYFGRGIYEKIKDRWEGIFTRMSNWLRTWPQ